MKRRLPCMILLLLAGCSQPMLLKPASTPSTEPLIFAQRYASLSAENQKKEYTLATQALSRGSDPTTRLKAALIFSLPSSRYRDNERALALLEEVLRDKQADADSRALAGVLKDYLSERQKLESNASRANQKAAEEQKRADSLQQKLDDLKNIEKALIERSQAGKK